MSKGIDKQHSSWMFSGIHVDNFVIVKMYIPMHKQQDESIQTFLKHSASVHILDVPEWCVCSLHSCTGDRTKKQHVKVDQPPIPSETYNMNLWMDSDILICLLSRSSNALRVSTGHKPIYEEYLELRVWIYEWVHRWTFHSCALRAANDENRIGGWSTLRMICMFGNMFALLNGCWSVVSRAAVYFLVPSTVFALRF